MSDEVGNQNVGFLMTRLIYTKGKDSITFMNVFPAILSKRFLSYKTCAVKNSDLYIARGLCDRFHLTYKIFGQKVVSAYLLKNDK